MCSDIVFIIGLVLLFRGKFRIFRRNVPAQLSRLIALILMTPVAASACIGMRTIRFEEDGSIDLASLAPVLLVQMIALAAALGLAGYLIAKLPESPPDSDAPRKSRFTPPKPQPIPANQPFPEMAASVPTIMTPAEAATYLHISEAKVRELIDASKLGAVKSGGDYRIAKRALDDYLAEDVFGDVDEKRENEGE